MKTLKSMVQFVLEKTKNEDIDFIESIQKLQSIYDYTNLLSQPPNIGMFVPAVCENGVWRVLEEPYNDGMHDHYYFAALNQYQQAKANIIFKGWVYKTEISELTLIESDLYDLYFDLIENRCHISTDNVYMKIHTLEDLVKFNLKMT